MLARSDDLRRHAGAIDAPEARQRAPVMAAQASGSLSGLGMRHYAATPAAFGAVA